MLRDGANPEGSLGYRLAEYLQTPRQLVLFAQGFLLMGGFVALYNFLGFRLTRAPFHLAPNARGWTAVAITILTCAGIAAVLAGLFLHDA